MKAQKRAKPVKFGKKTDYKTNEEKKITEAVSAPIQQPIITPPITITTPPEPVPQQPPAKITPPAPEVIQPENIVNENSVTNVLKTTQAPQPVDIKMTSENHTTDLAEEEQIVPTQNQKIPPPSPKETPEPTPAPSIPINGDHNNTYIVETRVKNNLLLYFFAIAAISFLIGLVSMAGISMFLGKTGFKLPFISTKITISPSPIPTAIIPSPTKAKEINLAEYKIEILNGSGVSGAASKLNKSLTAEGFSVSSIGNADKSNYTKTTIQAKKEVSSEYLTKLKESLKNTYSLSQDSTNQLPAGNTTDIIITIGSESATDSAK